MRFFSKIYFLIFFVALAAISYFSYPIIKQRYFTNNQIIPADNKNSQKDQPAAENSILKDQKNQESSGSTEEAAEIVPDEKTTVFKTVEKEDCLSGCSTFTTEKEKEYCLQVCNSPSSAENSDKCSEKSELQKDYCYKNLGIEKKDFNECKKITDRNIRESCINTVTDKILERSDSAEQRNP